MSAPVLQSSDHLHPDEQPLAEYSAISRLAVAALALGAASALIFASPLLIVVPLAGVTVAAVALRQIATSGGQLKGQWPATIGLCLATLFLGWGITQQLSRQLTLAEYAEQFAEDWLTLVKEGKLQRADQMRQTVTKRINDDKALLELYSSNKELIDRLQSFFGAEPLKSFREAGPQVRWRLDGISTRGKDLLLKYDFSAADGTERSMWITIGRSLEGMAQTPSWEIRSVDASLPSEL